MPTSRPRRIVRRAVMVVAVVVLLLAWYVGSWVLWPRVCDGILYGRAPTLVAAINRFFDPITSYSQSGCPGSDVLSRLWWWANPEYLWVEPPAAENSEE